MEVPVEPEERAVVKNDEEGGDAAETVYRYKGLIEYLS